MNVYELQKFIASEIENGNLDEESRIITTFYANSEWGETDIGIEYAKSVNGDLILSDKPIDDE